MRLLFPAGIEHGWGPERRWRHVQQGISTLIAQGLLVLDASFPELYRVTTAGLDLLDHNPHWSCEP